MKVSLYFYLNEEKKNNRQQTIPGYLRVRLNGKKAEGRLYYAAVSVKEKLLWDERTMRPIDISPASEKLPTVFTVLSVVQYKFLPVACKIKSLPAIP